MLARYLSKRRGERPASTSRPAPPVSTYVALPELPLESTLSLKKYGYLLNREQVFGHAPDTGEY